ncbi:hypothetical protein C7C46_21195, partial [Streptomyces tateyamensis]
AREVSRAERVARESDAARALGQPRFARSQPGPAAGGPVQAQPRPAAGPRQGSQPEPGPTVPGARPAGRERQQTPLPGRPGVRKLDARRRLRRQRLVVFVTVTLGVALVIAAAQGCQNRHAQGRPPAAPPAAASAGEQVGAAGPAIGLSADGVQPSAPAAPAARTSGGAGGAPLPAGFGPAPGPVPPVDWPNRSYPDPSGGPAVQLHDGRSAGSPQVALTAVLPARYRGAQAELVVLRRTDGSVPVDLVELFAFTPDSPTLLTARSSAADPQSTATWRLDEGALTREERVTQTGATTTTRYAVRADGTLDESWPGAGISGGIGG